ncbi:MAG: type IV pilus secretin PilQ [Rhodanobacter sp.]|nr:type IV pilus secretin PilQ [Rhodanobacter sp.]
MPTIRAVFVLLLLSAFALRTAHAQNVLNDIAYTALPGSKIQITLKFTHPTGEPQSFSTEVPPSIALDFADTHNAMTKRRVDIGAGAVSGVSAIEVAGRTRVVVELFRIASYDTHINGNDVVLTISNGLAGATGIVAAVGRTDPTKAIASASAELGIANVDFRRGKNGEGRLIVTFADAGAIVDMKRAGEHISLDIPNVKLPPNLAQHLDVLDFATPVQSIDTNVRNNGVHVEIAAKAPFEQLAYQTANEYVVEVAQKKDDSKLKNKNAQPEYNGNRVTFNFQDIPTRSVLQLIADVSNLNVVVSDSVQGNVTLRLINVPWDQALDIVLQAKGLDKRQRGNVIWVAPQKEISDREEAIAVARTKLEDNESLVSDYIPISYGKAKDIAALLTKNTRVNTATAAGAAGANNTAGVDQQRGFLSSRGSVTYDDRTNTLLVSDTPSKVEEIRRLIVVLDRPVRQVLIESRIVIANDSFARSLGVKFGVSGGYQTGNGTVVATTGTLAGADQMAGLALNNRLATGNGLPISTGSPSSGVAVPSLGNALNVNLPATGTTGSIGVAILGADYLLDLELSAAQSEGRGEVVSSPRVVTANQKEATIVQGQEIGYLEYAASQSASGGGAVLPTVAFKQANLELKVTPTITADNRINLDLNVKKDDVAGYIQVPGGGSVPTLNRREVGTTVLVDDGQTVVLGGVYEVNKTDSINKVPVLGDVPVLGNLFKNSSRSDTKAELLIFVTPRILNENLK